ncbi:MAG: hypothetical protein WAW85_06635 [Gordonia sp. (in: high G+C Gram-positive bacteria)]|uniref:hypothetical protein n=1 Tax=Gordonia sp. (in: high G+C Gram-positive bacteria) TaxID=84139 RepID=UPI003BB5B359
MLIASQRTLLRRSVLSALAIVSTAAVAISGCSSSDAPTSSPESSGAADPSATSTSASTTEAAPTDAQWEVTATLKEVRAIVGSKQAAVVVGPNASTSQGQVGLRGFTPDGTSKGSTNISDKDESPCGFFAFDSADGPRVGYRTRSHVEAAGIVPEKWQTNIVVRDALTLDEKWSTKVAEHENIDHTGCDDATVETTTYNGQWVVVSVVTHRSIVLDSATGKIAQQLDGYPEVRGNYVGVSSGPEMTIVEPGTGKKVAELSVLKNNSRLRSLQGILMSNEIRGGDGERGIVYDDEMLYLVSWRDGSVVKKIPLPGELDGSIVVDNESNRVYVPVKTDGKFVLLALDAANGYSELWRQTGPRDACVVYPKSVIVRAESGNFASLSPEDGSQQTHTDIDNTVSCGLIVGDYTFMRVGMTHGYQVIRFAP